MSWLDSVTSFLEPVTKFTTANPWIGPTVSFLGSMYTNRKNSEMMQDYRNSPLGPRIRDGMRYGIHPLAAIGAQPGPMPTIPMQNSLSQLSPAFTQPQESEIDAQLKVYALNAAKEAAYDAKYNYELLIPVKHKDMPGKTVWAFNPRYLAFGTFASAVVMAANKDMAMKLMKEQLKPEEGTYLDRILKAFQ